jgi:hypothetical protein
MAILATSNLCSKGVNMYGNAFRNKTEAGKKCKKSHGLIFAFPPLVVVLKYRYRQGPDSVKSGIKLISKIAIKIGDFEYMME